MKGLTALLASCVLSACAASPDVRRDDSVDIALSAARINAGETGRAFLVPLGDRTQATIIVSGVPVELASRPVHLYTFIYKGSCSSLSEPPSYALNERVLTQSTTSTVGGPLNITNVAPVAILVLQREPHAIRIMTSPADGNREIFCGDIPPSVAR
jgi:hypothetical protein